MSESKTPAKPATERRDEVEAMLESVKREVSDIHSSMNKRAELWDVLRPDLWSEQAGPLWQEYEALYNTAQVIRVRRLLQPGGGRFTLPRLYELINPDRSRELVSGWDVCVFV